MKPTQNIAYIAGSGIRALGNESRRGAAVVLEGGRDLLLGLVVACQTVDTRLDENETELGVPVFSVDLEMLADGNGLFDEVPKVLRDGRCETVRFQDTEDFVSSEEANLGDTVRVS